MSDFISELIGAIVQLLAFSLIPFIWWLITARKKESFFHWIGLRKIVKNGKLWVTILVTIAIVLLYGFATNFFVEHFAKDVTNAGSQFAGKGLGYIPAAIVYGFIRTGLSEEIVFRGFILKRVAARFGFLAGNIVQALLFGLAHGIPFGLATGNVLVTIALTLLPGALGFCMGYLNEKKCGGSILPSYIVHGVVNTLVVISAL